MEVMDTYNLGEISVDISSLCVRFEFVCTQT